MTTNFEVVKDIGGKWNNNGHGRFISVKAVFVFVNNMINDSLYGEIKNGFE